MSSHSSQATFLVSQYEAVLDARPFAPADGSRKYPRTMNPYEPPSAPVSDQPSMSRERPWFVTVWLWLMIVANGLTASGYLFFAHVIQRSLPHVSEFQIMLFGVVGVANVVFSVALLRWKKWGVWGLLLTAIVAFAFNYWTAGLASALLGLSGFVILVVLLNVGRERRVWPKLSKTS